MKYLFLFLLVSMSFIVISQNRYHVDKTTFNPLYTDVVYLKYDMTPVNGILYDSYSDSNEVNEVQLKSEINYRAGKKEGVSKKWWESGNLKYERSFKDGKQNGFSRGWYEDGQLWFERNFTDGKLNGLRKGWHENGQLKFEYNYRDSKRDGLSRKWYDNGLLDYQSNYKDGKLISEKCFDKDGNKIICP
jgi:antitoxin component YwqK of YwqJK toxin-antitoxin module